MVEGWTRRGLLVGGVGTVGATFTGCDDVPAPTPPSTRNSPSATPWSTLARHTEGRLVRPGQRGYDRLRLTPNPRYDDARPLALLEVASADDVATALRFAADHAVPVVVRSGGHSYPGWSSGGSPRALVIDCRRLSRVAADRTTATIGPGATLGAVYPALAARGRALPGGSCPTVGIGGLTLGGGVGVVTRAYGLLCDHLTSAEVVLADGRIVTADATSEPDLFWALRGGGGARLGVVSSMRFATVAAPELVTTYLTWPLARLSEVVPAWSDWIGAADAQAWSTLKILGGTSHPSGPSIGATVTWAGAGSRFESMLAPLLATGPSGRYDHVRSFAEAMQAYGGSGAREAFAATSHIAYGAMGVDESQVIVDRVAAVPATLREAGISIDALGGRVADVAPDATAFVHREALATVQYTATYAGASARPAVRCVEGFRNAMTPLLGDHGYVNYADPRVSGSAYFGANWKRLQAARATYDPHAMLGPAVE